MIFLRNQPNKIIILVIGIKLNLIHRAILLRLVIQFTSQLLRYLPVQLHLILHIGNVLIMEVLLTFYQHTIRTLQSMMPLYKKPHVLYLSQVTIKASCMLFLLMVHLKQTVSHLERPISLHHQSM